MPQVLIVDGDKERRAQLVAACEARGATPEACEDAFAAMNALGKTTFDVILAHAGKRHLSLRGLLQLAKRKNRQVVTLVLADESDEPMVRRAMGADVLVMRASRPYDEIAAAAVPEEPAAPLVEPPSTAPDAGFEAPPKGGAWEAGTGNHAITAEGLPVAESAQATARRAGAEALLDALARELTGALRVRDGDAAYTLFVYSGEPAWVHPDGGDAIVFERLVGARALPPDATPTPVTEGELLRSLIGEGALAIGAASDVMRDLVQEQTIALVQSVSAEVEAVEDSGYLRTPPPFRLHPFGMLLEARKQELTPDGVLAEAATLAGAELKPRSSLARVAGKIAPFIRGGDLSQMLTSQPTLAAFGDASGLDATMSTLFALGLRDAGLIDLTPPPPPPAPAGIALPSSKSAGPVPTEETTDSPVVATLTPTDVIASIEDAILPNEIVGVEVVDELNVVEATYEARAAALDPAGVPEELRVRARKALERLNKAVTTMRATAI